MSRVKFRCSVGAKPLINLLNSGSTIPQRKQKIRRRRLKTRVGDGIRKKERRLEKEKDRIK